MIEPVGPVNAYQTYAITNPTATHTRPATCAEVECEHYLKGWVTQLDLTTTLGIRQAKYITEKSGRSFTVDGRRPPFCVFTFPAGQRCFRAHRVPLERQPIFRRRDGDTRGNPTGLVVVHRHAEDWRDDMGEHLEKIKELRERG